MALSGVPFAYQAIAYELRKHHRLSNIDWDALPFTTARSVHEFHEVGSHVLFLTRVERETVPDAAKGPQLFHSFGPYR